MDNVRSEVDGQQVTRVNIDLPNNWIGRKADCGLTWRNIVGLGLQSAEDNPGFINRIRVLEDKVKRLEILFGNFSNDLVEIKKVVYKQA